MAQVTILDLVDECCLDIFKFLSLWDVFNFANTCQYMMFICGQYLSNFSEFGFTVQELEIKHVNQKEYLRYMKNLEFRNWLKSSPNFDVNICQNLTNLKLKIQNNENGCKEPQFKFL